MCLVLFYWNLEINTLFFASSCHFIAVDWNVQMCFCCWLSVKIVCVCLLGGKSIYHMHNDHTPGHCSCLHAVGFQFSHLTTHTLFFRGILFFFEKLEHQKSVEKKTWMRVQLFLQIMQHTHFACHLTDSFIPKLQCYWLWLFSAIISFLSIPKIVKLNKKVNILTSFGSFTWYALVCMRECVIQNKQRQ